ncbi:MAG: MATE family efflux transporter [Clostridiales bacterium]|nr:MATE family efflux transporter [Clostridiales bacterium]
MMKPTAYVRDMTQGSAFRLIVSFAFPLLVGNLFQQFYNLVDTMVVGYRLGDQAIAAIGATVSLYSLIINFACDLNNGYGIVVTQRFGAHQPREMRQAVAGMMELNTAISLGVTVLSLVFLRPLLHFMNTPEAIVEQSYAYIFAICAGIPVTIAYNMFSAILRALGNSRSPLGFLILSSVLNVVLDLLFVWGLDMGIAGAAVATVIAQLVAALNSGLYVWRHYREYLPTRSDWHVSGRMLVSLFTTGFALALTSCVVELGTVIFQRTTNLLGELLITAHSASRRIVIMMLQPIMTMAAANMTFVGQNYGAGKMERIRPAVRLTMVMEIIWCLIAATVVYLFGEQLICFTTGTTNREVIDNAVFSLRIQFAPYPVLGVLFCYRNTLQAMGQKIVPVLSSCIELAMKLIAAGWLIPKLGFLGVCITEPVTWILMVAFLASAYAIYQKKWFQGTYEPPLAGEGS